MNARHVMLAAAALVSLTGCQGNVVTPFDISGSKADGTVVIGGTLLEFDRMEWGNADGIAAERCAVWGYSGAKPFSGIRSQCMNPLGWFGCAEREVTRTYQCLD